MTSPFTNGPLVQYVDTQVLHTGDVEDFNNLVLEAETTPSRDRHFFPLTNGLKLNAKKTERIFLGTRQFVPKTPARTTTQKPCTTLRHLHDFRDVSMS